MHMSETQAPRPLHRRSIDHQAWLHEDGSMELESRLIDSKPYDTQIGFDRTLPAGQPVHDMTIRLLLGPDGLIRDIHVRMDSAPFPVCPEVISRFEGLRGVGIGKGWNRLLSERFNGVGGCRHLVDLLRGMGTVAFQSFPRSGWSQEGLARMTDSCYAFHQGGAVMLRLAAEVSGKSDQEYD
jgi:hypothetical protein